MKRIGTSEVFALAAWLATSGGCIENQLLLPNGKDAPFESPPADVDPGTSGPSDTEGVPPSTTGTTPTYQDPSPDPPNPDGPSGLGDASTRGTEFLFSFAENLSLDRNGPPELIVEVSGAPGTTGALEMLVTGGALAFTLDASGMASLSLGSVPHYPENESERVTDYGLRLTADAPVRAVAVHQRLYFTDGTTLLPTPELGSRYLVITVPDIAEAEPTGFVVVGVEDETWVTIVPTVQTWGLHGAGAPFEVVLGRGDTYEVLASGDLTGTEITSDLPVAVLGFGPRNASSCSPNSHAWEQLPPVERQGRAYVVAPFAEQGPANLVLVASADDTQVWVGADVYVLADREVLRTVVDRATEISATAPLSVAQVATGGSCSPSGLGDANLLVHATVELGQTRARWRAESSWIEGEVGDPTPRHFATVVTAPGATITLDGTALAGFVDAGSYSVATFEVPPGVHELDGDLPFVGYAYGWGEWNGYTFHLGFDCEDCAGVLGGP